MSQRSDKGNQTGSGVPVESYVGDAKSLGAAEFAARHGDGFLLLTAHLIRKAFKRSRRETVDA